MRLHHLIVIASLLISSLGGRLVADEPEFERIFDGKSLQGWSGDPKLWSVQDNSPSTLCSYGRLCILSI